MFGQVKCDCVHPACAECRKRKLLCEYQNDASVSKLPDSDQSLSIQDASDITAPAESSLPQDRPVKELQVPRYSCQFAGDTLSILADTDDVRCHFVALCPLGAG